MCDIFVGDFIWEDLDADGVQDPGEPGCEGATVYLNDSTDCLTLDVDSDTTDAFGEYGFRVATVDAVCAPLTDVDVSIRVDLTGSSCEGFNGSPKDATTDDLDSDCDPATGVTDCRQDLTEDDLDIDCGYERELVAFCRTPGFWGARGDGEKGGFNYTAAAIDAAGGCLNVCGVDICDTVDDALENLGNALEAMCVRSNDRSQQNQLFRQMTAGALNCAASGDPSCSFLDGAVGESLGLKGITWADCTASCIGGADDPIAQMCIHQIDCFNNGGIWDESLGCLPSGQCVDAAGNVDGYCFDENNCADGYDCVGNCHVEEFCNLSTYDYFANGHLVCSDVSLTGKEELGPASSSKLCNSANRNNCTINAYVEGNDCGEDGLCCGENSCTIECAVDD